MPIQIGLACGTLLRLPLHELIEVAARYGFGTITARPLSFTEAIAEGSTEASLRRHLSDAGLRVTMIDCLSKGLPGMPSPDSLSGSIRERLPPDALDPPDEDVVMQCAEALEAPWVNVSHFLGHRVPMQEMTEAIGRVSRRAASHGLGIALEFNPDTGLPDIAYAQAIATGCGEPNCKITLDLWHLDRSEGGVDDIRALPPGALAGIQLNDRIRPAPGAAYVPMAGRALPGEGELQLGALVSAALLNSPGISAEVEVFSEELNGLSADAVGKRVSSSIASWLASIADRVR